MHMYGMNHQNEKGYRRLWRICDKYQNLKNCPIYSRLDLHKVRKYPVDILERRKQKIEEEVIEKLKKATEKVSAEKFVIFVDGGTTRVIRKDFADRLVNWAKGKNKFKLGIKSVAQSSATGG